jgi:Predicted transcriptional regulators
MDIVGKRLKSLRETLNISQSKLSKLAGTTQSTINRYEQGETSPSVKTFLWYADYFDVSLDYVFGRTDKPQGTLYNFEPEAVKAKMVKEEDWQEFVEACFEPGTPMNEKLKRMLLGMMGGDNS